ncbi:MAG: twin-arginine translocation signal domain-containing protein, partial [Anaerolineales bacterium]
MSVSSLDRRSFLKAIAAAPAALTWPDWMPRMAFSAEGVSPRGDTLLVIFLRGAADSLNIVVPHGDE